MRVNDQKCRKSNVATVGTRLEERPHVSDLLSPWSIHHTGYMETYRFVAHASNVFLREMYYFYTICYHRPPFTELWDIGILRVPEPIREDWDKVYCKTK